MIERITDKYVFFWNGIFSNWQPAIFEYKDHRFENSEQAFMWEKALAFDDKDIANKILLNSDPRKTKGLGRKVKNFDADKWEKVSLDIMIEVNMEKFSQNLRMEKHLLSTNDKIIVEASPYDKIWGIGLHQDDDRVLDESQWDGLNKLGIALMEVRTKMNERKYD